MPTRLSGMNDTLPTIGAGGLRWGVNPVRVSGAGGARYARSASSGRAATARLVVVILFVGRASPYGDGEGPPEERGVREAGDRRPRERGARAHRGVGS